MPESTSDLDAGEATSHLAELESEPVAKKKGEDSRGEETAASGLELVRSQYLTGNLDRIELWNAETRRARFFWMQLGLTAGIAVAAGTLAISVANAIGTSLAASLIYLLAAGIWVVAFSSIAEVILMLVSSGKTSLWCGFVITMRNMSSGSTISLWTEMVI